LLATGAVAAAVGALVAAPLARRVHSSWLLAATSFISLLAIVVTPLLGLYVLYLLAQVARGATVGISTPLIITDMSHAVGPDQGKAVGLRTMANRGTSTFTPIAMGALVAWFGLGGSFLAAGAVMAVVMAGILLFARAKKIL
jgi:MFS family permease